MTAIQHLGIIHRDVKSANVLLEIHNGVVMNAVICDFGLSKVTSTANTLEGSVFEDIAGFSTRYAAPEMFAYSTLQAPPPPEVELKCDVYSFSIVIWEMLSGEVAWKGLGRDEIEFKVRSGERVSFNLSLTLLGWWWIDGRVLVFFPWLCLFAGSSPKFPTTPSWSGAG